MWRTLEDINQLEKISQESFEKPVAIFKHSTRCGISRMVLRNFEGEIKSKDSVNTELYFLDLIANRDISNEIASKFDITHESPQLIIIKDGKAIFDVSHHGISADNIS
ncbi:MAG: bacillithiol system redox-active protein YtxJ [Saprospiraceae bacterium]|nr:bacillithiol system redox-active protein YtxJ [Bacteroidia bacterium]NNE14786.1 bacillithiol system redox-active protein YtxJ [Saprospiraceae bacterium]NNL92876.1 bacillithiol system redox-active protein YtxJ [Saprospiraceae bacterium]